MAYKISNSINIIENFDIKSWFAARDGERHEFLRAVNWQDADVDIVNEDCAMRRYLRLTKQDGESAILMESLPDDDPHATPGHKIADYIRIGQYLRAVGIKTPEIFEADEPSGYVLLEDFGDYTFKKAIEDNKADRYELYKLATEALVHLRKHASPRDLGLPGYYDSTVHKDLRNVIDWYQREVTGVKPSEDVVQSYLACWKEIEESLPPCPQGFLHVDYHFENLMWIPGQSGLAACGVLDFQQAKQGPAPYDLANLLYDARTLVPENIKKDMLALYCADMSAEEAETFKSWLRVLAAQFHCRVIGLFVRMARRDGKYGYLPHIPRLAYYLREELQHPDLLPLKRWFDAHNVSFEDPDLPDVKAA